MPGAPTPPGAADFEAAGLYDPAAPDAGDRLALLTHLAAQGVTIDEMKAAPEPRLVTLAANPKLFDFGQPMTVEEVARACGVSVERVLRIRLASGFGGSPDALVPAWTPEDIAGFEAGAAFFGDAPLLAFTRVMGAAAARVAEAGIALFSAQIENRLDTDEASLLDRALANEQATDLAEIVTTLMEHLVREHLALAVTEQRETETKAAARTVYRLAIAFVDLASSTEWVTALPLREQAEALARFESLAWDITTAGGGRVAKLIGDEAMIACRDPADACRIALEICAAVAKDPDLPMARGAVGFGDVVVRDGDYFSPLVHVVARAVKAADEGCVVVTDSVAEAVGPAFRLDPIGPQQLKGIDQPVELSVVRFTEDPT